MDDPTHEEQIFKRTIGIGIEVGRRVGRDLSQHHQSYWQDLVITFTTTGAHLFYQINNFGGKMPSFLYFYQHPKNLYIFHLKGKNIFYPAFLYIITMIDTNRFHYVKPDHFLEKNFMKFKYVVPRPDDRKAITDINIQASGHGYFSPQTILKNFQTYFVDMMQTCVDEKIPIKSLKITFAGFEIKDGKIIEKMCQEIVGIRDSIRLLWIHTSNLSHMTLKCFSNLLELSEKLAQPSFQEFSLQCATWIFSGNPPTMANLKEVLGEFAGNASSLHTIKNKRFRLEMSGWYYEENHALGFLELQKEGLDSEILNKTIQEFHLNMNQFVSSLLGGMSEVEEFQLDLRNWHNLLRMKKLKEKLDNVSVENRKQVSIMSQKKGVALNQGDQEEKALKMNIAV